jgi:hypothetical protein
MINLILWIPKSDIKSPASHFLTVIVNIFYIFLPDTAGSGA